MKSNCVPIKLYLQKHVMNPGPYFVYFMASNPFNHLALWDLLTLTFGPLVCMLTLPFLCEKLKVPAHHSKSYFMLYPFNCSFSLMIFDSSI